MLKTYLKELFEPTLLFGFLSASIGIIAARHYGFSNLFLSILIIIGVVLAQISANVLNDYFDYTSGLDRETTKTMFSGGSALLGNKKGLIKPKTALFIGLITLLLAAAIGVNLALMAPSILPLLIIGGLSAALYGAFLSKIPLMSEILVTLNFTLICYGAFIILAGPYNLFGNLFIFLPAGILPATALLVNSVPDKKVDKKYGRRHAAVLLWNNKKIALYYLSLQAIAYALIIAGVLKRYIPFGSVIAVATIPMSIYVFIGIFTYKGVYNHTKYMGLHADTSFLTLFIFIAAYMI